MSDFVVSSGPKKTGELAQSATDEFVKRAKQLGLTSDPLSQQLVDGLHHEDLKELTGVSSVYARNQGQCGLPSSTLISNLAKLGMLYEQCEPTSDNPFLHILSVVADAYTLGSIDRFEARRRRHLENHVPLLVLPNKKVLLCPVGPLTADTLDALVHRAFVLVLQAEATELVIELAFVEDLNEQLIIDTLVGFPGHTMADQVSIIVSGVPAPADWTAQLSAAGVAPTQVQCISKLANYTWKRSR